MPPGPPGRRRRGLRGRRLTLIPDGRVASRPLPPGAAALRCAAVTGDTHPPPAVTAWMSQPCRSYDVDVASTPYDLARGGAGVTGARCRVLAADAAAKAEWQRAAFHRRIGTSPKEYRALFRHRAPTTT